MALEGKHRGITAIFNPKSVAVVGASDDPKKLGYQVMRSLTTGKEPQKVIPVNLSKKCIMGLETYPSLINVDDDIDLAVILLPAHLAPASIKECILKKVKGIILITAGFTEIEDPSGYSLQREVSELASRADIPIIGPNCFGVFNVKSGMNATFNPDFSDTVKAGKVALMSQSGGVAGAIGYESRTRNIGFSKIISLGNRCNTDFAEMLEYLMDDPDTEVIAMYMEGIDEPRLLLEAVSKFRGKKPVIAYKVGKSKASDLASQSHTGSLAGRFDIYLGAFRQAGLIMVDSVTDLLDVAQALACSPIPNDSSVAILSGQAGLAMTACDVCDTFGMQINPFSPETQTKLNRFLPPVAIRTNPVDLGPAWNNMSVVRNAIEALLNDKVMSSLLLLFVMSGANEDNFSGLSEAFERVTERKPVLSSILSLPGGKWETEIKALEQSGSLVNYPTPERAARALAGLWEYQRIRNLSAQ